MNRALIVGIHGPAGCGKDTAAQHLVDELDYRRIAFADPIKQMLNQLPGFSARKWEMRSWKEQELEMYGKSPRQMAQLLGTEWGRMISNVFWVTVMQHKLEDMGDYRVVIPDVRFENEAKWIRESGGTVVTMERDGVMEVAPHVSNLPLEYNEQDYSILNNGTFEFLHHAIERAHNYAVERLRNHPE